MYVTYTALFLKDDDVVSVMFPDVEGAITFGNDLEHAHGMATDCLKVFLKEFKDRKHLPKATPFNEVPDTYDVDIFGENALIAKMLVTCDLDS